MCGIVGYIGRRQAQPILFNCLEKLEYRGYDSCGIALADNGITVFKDRVRVGELRRISPALPGTLGIGHTRWATHGKPSLINAHPHGDCTGKIAVVHNGVIVNYQTLRKQLIAEGHRFVSETDSEVISHLVEKYYAGDIEEAVSRTVRELRGSYAIIVIADTDGKLVAARSESPLIIGIGDRENFIASDMPAVLDYTNRFIFLEDGDVAVVVPGSITVSREGARIEREEHEILWDAKQAQRGGYEHFMLKEIHEQPRVIRDTLVEYNSESEPVAGLASMRESGFESMLMLACGTSYYAGLVGKYLFEDLARIPVRVELASEFNYYNHILARTMGIVITQSGETADVIKAMKRLKGVGCRVLAITNVAGSSATRLADQTIYTRAGPEMSVAATKSFTGELMVLYRLAISYSQTGVRRTADLLAGLRSLPNQVQRVLSNGEGIQECARYLAGFENVFFVGRGINYPVALEGALKLKEISYIHAEGYAAGELKHGPFSLLGEKTPVVALTTEGDTGEAILTNLKEIKARGSPVIAVTDKDDETMGDLADFVITVPRVEPIFSPVVNVVALQLLAYFTAKERGCDIDFPRNLAKSVTVE